MFLLCALSFCNIPEISAQGRPVPETQIMAVFLFNFTQFTAWPPSAFSSPEAPLIIGIAGPDPFGKFLQETINSETVQGHPLEIRRFRSVEDIGKCHVLYINERDPAKVSEIIIKVTVYNTLTVSDCVDFCKLGGMIGFFRKNNKIKLQVNPGAAQNAGLIISSKLLRVAEIRE
jgi:hypothetical protein